MNVTCEQSGDVVIVHAGPARLMHPSLSEFSTLVTGELARGATKLVINFAGVEYLDSAAIGCLMDLYRQATAAGATMKLAGLRSRVDWAARASRVIQCAARMPWSRRRRESCA